MVFMAIIFIAGLYFIITHKRVKKEDPREKLTNEILAEAKASIEQYHLANGVLPPIVNLAEALKWGEGKKGKLDDEGRILDGWDHPIVYNKRLEKAEKSNSPAKERGFIIFSFGRNGHNDAGMNDGTAKDDIAVRVEFPSGNSKEQKNAEDDQQGGR